MENWTNRFLQDLIVGARRFEVWRTFAIDDIQQRYRRSVLGIAWIIVSYLLFVGGISVIFSAFTDTASTEFVIHVALGYAAFMFIISNLTDGCDVFIRAATWIKSVSLPYSIYVYRSIFRSLLPFALQFGVAIVIMFFAGWRPSAVILLALPAIAVYLLNAVAVQYLAGLIGARFRDFSHLVASITRLMFFVTPILWVRSDMDGARSYVADLNPLSHYIEILRAPLMNEAPTLLSWAVVGGCTVAVWGLLLLSAARTRRRLAYWV